MKIKIVSTYPPMECGVAEHTRHLVNSLKKIGIEPEIFKIKNRTSSNPFQFINLAKKVAKDNSQKDIIHIQFHLAAFGKFLGIVPGFYIIIFLAWLNFFSKAKVIMTLHDSPSKKYAIKKGGKEKAFFFYYKFIYIFLRLFVNHFIVHSKNGKRISVREWKIDKTKVSVLPLGLPVNITELNKNRSKINLGYRNKHILLILGYIRYSKDYSLVLDALKKLNKKVILLIVGKIQQKKDQATYDNLLKKIEELKLGDRVKLLGFVDNKKLSLVLNATDIGINLHSQGSGDFFSSTMAMQMAYGIPILSRNISSFEIFKKEEKCIETFDANSTSDLAKKVEDLLHNTSKIKYLEKGTKKYWKDNNWNEIGKRTKKVYLTLSKLGKSKRIKNYTF